MDALADVLTVAGVRATVGATIEAGADWGWWAAPSGDAAIHAVAAGTAWIALAHGEPVQLMPGDVVLLPRGDEHVIAGDEDALRRTGPDRFDAPEGTGPGVISIGSGPVRSRVLCAHYRYDATASTRVLDVLPDLVHLRSEAGGDGLEDTVRMLARELTRPQLASAVVLDSLVDVLLVQLLRTWVAAHPTPAAPSWLGALGDPVVGPAVAAIHDDPARDWTTATLAHEVASSRATLARRFPLVLGQTPAAYLTRWRMDLAARALRDTDEPLDAVARDVGYTSVHAFSRAFRRAWDQPPGRFRVSSRAAAAAPPASSGS